MTTFLVTIIAALAAGYAGGWLHRGHRYNMRRRKAWENGTALRQYAVPATPMDFEALSQADRARRS